jgi:hypothetical protein
MWSWQVVVPASGTVRDAVDHAPARAADAFAAVRVERDRVLALADEIFVDDVQHFEKGHVSRDALRHVVHQAAGLILRRLAPYPQIYRNRLR